MFLHSRPPKNPHLPTAIIATTIILSAHLHLASQTPTRRDSTNTLWTTPRARFRFPPRRLSVRALIGKPKKAMAIEATAPAIGVRISIFNLSHFRRKKEGAVPAAEATGTAAQSVHARGLEMASRHQPPAGKPPSKL